MRTIKIIGIIGLMLSIGIIILLNLSTSIVMPWYIQFASGGILLPSAIMVIWPHLKR